MTIPAQLPDPDAHAARIERESQFWDERQSAADSRDPALYRVTATDRTDRSVPWLQHLGFDRYIACMLDHIQMRPGMRLLDLGTGTGFLATLLAANGAEVDSLDVSESSLEVARWRARISGVADRIRFHLMPAEALAFPDAVFDAACGNFVLHHLNLPVAAAELRRVLKPGAGGAFLETCDYNILLRTARRWLPGHFGIEKASSDDEAPLGIEAQATLRGVFGESVRFAYPDTVMFRMLSYVPPLHRRPARMALAACDRLLHAVPRLRSLSYHGVVCLRRD